MSSSLKFNKVTVSYGSKTILENQSFLLDKPEIISIIGANGAGKTTMLKTICNLLRPETGAIYLANEEIAKMDNKKLAQKIAMLHQNTIAPQDITVERLVSLGRSPYRKFLRDLQPVDRMAIKEAMQATDVYKYKDRSLYSLSGGQRQRAWLALTICQEPAILLLDEPTTYLDSHHQIQLMELITKLHAKRNITVIMVLHDINLAIRYSHRVMAIFNGEIVGDGKPEEIISKENMRRWFNVEADILKHRIKEKEYLIYLPYAVSEELE